MPMSQVNPPTTNVDWLTPLSLIRSLGEFDGTATKVNINRPCCLVAYGARNLSALMDSGLDGALVTEVRR